MRNAYIFYDRDDKDEPLPFEGTDFARLLEVCVRYCAFFSLVLLQETAFQKAAQLDAFLVEERSLLPEEKIQKEDGDKAVIRFYRVDEKSVQALLNISRNLWDFVYWWGYQNPEDLTFYRVDSSVFFRCIAHEGEAILSPQENEDITPVLGCVRCFPMETWDTNAGIHYPQREKAATGKV